jgi:Spy/CpxP family protein refolding chaperone
VKKTFVLVVLAFCLGSASAYTLAASQQSAARPAAEPSIDDVLKAMRADLQGQRADIMAKNLTLTSEQAAKFWPMFQKYQEQQNAIMDAQHKAIQQYVEGFDKLDDAGAMAFINGHFTRDEQMSALRKRWLGEFQTTVGTKTAVRAMQIDRRLSLATQMQISASIPLVH